MLKRHLDIIFIFLGCIIISIAFSLKLYTRYEQKKLVDSYRAYVMDMQNQDTSFNRQKDDITTKKNQSQNRNAIKDKLKKKQTISKVQKPSNMIGILSIPKINLCVGIGEGVDRKTLRYSVGHFVKTAMPGQKGNLCIIGHRSYTYGEFFNRLNEIKKNDDIIVESGKATYRYKVIEIKVVKPDEVSVLKQTRDAEITLITCTPIHIGTHRLIIKGILSDG